MATVTVNGNTYSDGSNDGGIGLKYLGNNGHRTNFVPLISDTVIDVAAKVSMAGTVATNTQTAVTKAAEAAASAVSAAASAETALSVAAQDLTAISQSKSGTIVASEIYDASSDTDGGIAIAKAGLPALMSIIATSTTVTIYSNTNVTVPQIAQITSLTGITSVIALQGRIFVGHSGGLNVYDILNNFALLTTYTTTTSPAIVANTVQCLAAVVLPTSPIEASTGLAIPVIYCGTLGGVSRIADDGTVSNWTDTSGSAVDDVYNIGITGDYVYWSTATGSSSGVYIDTIPVTSVLSAFSAWGSSYLHFVSNSSDVWSSTKTPYYYGGITSNCNEITRNALATNRSLTILQPNTTDWGKGLHATITKDFNSGYQFGDIRGAWLCQGTAETLTANDLVTGDSSTFTSGVGSWSTTGYDASIAAPSGKLEVTSLGGSASLPAGASITVTCVVGKTYVISADIERITGRVAPTLAVQGGGSTSQTTVGTVAVSLSFVALATSINIGVYEGSTTETAGLAFRVDNITVKIAEPDVSYNNRALTVVGSIVKSAVGTGNDLMGYSGFSASNYFSGANPLPSIGTNDFNIMGWFKIVSATGYYLDIDSPTTAARISLIASGSNINFAVSDNTNSAAVLASSIFGTGWRFCVFTKSGSSLLAYVDGYLAATASIGSVGSLTNASAVLRVGEKVSSSAPATGLTLCLFKIGAGAPTAAQIKSAYDREKLMFVANTKCLLPGTSNDVKAIAYDDSTDTHHYVTGDYYGAHKGLVRVDSAAGVYTSISANSGTVIKGA